MKYIVEIFQRPADKKIVKRYHLLKLVEEYYTLHLCSPTLHREDGPAVDLSDGRKYWYLHGKIYYYDKYLEELSKTKSPKEILMLRLKYG